MMSHLRVGLSTSFPVFSFLILHGFLASKFIQVELGKEESRNFTLMIGRYTSLFLFSSLPDLLLDS
jgi:hypothetical protein